MPTLYIDVDDTLVKWGDVLEGRITESWEPNEAVIRYAEQWDGDVVVWSGGGREYARTWGHRLLSHVRHKTASKFPLVPTPGDVCIDDSPFEVWKHVTVHPRDLE